MTEHRISDKKLDGLIQKLERIRTELTELLKKK